MDKKYINKDVILTPLQEKSLKLRIIRGAEKYPEFNKIALQRAEESRVRQIKELEEIQKAGVLNDKQQQKLKELIALGEKIKEEQNKNRLVQEEKAKNQNQK